MDTENRDDTEVEARAGNLADYMANVFYDQFVEAGALNCLMYDFSHVALPENEVLTVTVQRISGKTPTQLLVDAEDKIAELEQKIAALEAENHILECDLAYSQHEV